MTRSAGGDVSVNVMSQEQISQLKMICTFRREHEVVQYLRQHPYLFEVLLEAGDVIPQFFGADERIVLEVVVDYDHPAGRQLYVWICTALDRAQAWAMLDDLDSKWWYDAADRTRYNMNIELEFTHV